MDVASALRKSDDEALAMADFIIEFQVAKLSPPSRSPNASSIRFSGRASGVAGLTGVSRFNPLAAELIAKHFRMFLRREAEDVVSNVIPPKVMTARAER